LLVPPLIPPGRDVRAGRRGGAECRGRAAVAANLDVVDVGDGVEGGPLALDCQGALLRGVAFVPVLNC
jgi:hypothetical protein